MRNILTKHLPNIFLFGFLIGLVTILSRVYISNERYFYYWDYAMYQNMSTDQVYTAKQSIPTAINNIVKSMGDDYNKLFIIPLIPVLGLTGHYFLRTNYILSLAWVYFLPYILIIGLVARKMLNIRPGLLFWVTVLVAFFTPATWLPTLRGYPDTGGACLIALALWTVLYDPRLTKPWQIILIGISLAMSVLFRRHYAYGVSAFFFTVTISILVVFIFNIWRYRKYRFDFLLKNASRLGLVLLTTLVVLLTIGRVFVQTVITNKSQLFYAAWQNRPMTVLHNMGGYYGWLGILLAVAGLILGIIYIPQNRKNLSLVTLFSGITIIQWIFVTRQSNPQYTLHFTIIIILGIVTLVSLVWTKLKGVWRAIGTAIIAIYLGLNAAIGIAPQIFPYHLYIQSAFAAQTAPLQLPDYDQVVNLLDQLHSLSTQHEPMAVIASSGLMNYDLLSTADHALFPSKPLKLIFAPEIDSRDYYPIEVLLQAKYLIIIDPIQLHLAPSEQNVLRIVHQAFAEHWEIASHFIRLPETYKLTESVNANIYQRTQDIDINIAIRTLEEIQDSVGSKPYHQPDWIRLSGFSSNLVSNHQGKYRLQASLTKPAIFLYLGKIPISARISGNILGKNPECGTVTLNTSAVTVDNKIIPIGELKIPTDREQPFSIDFPSQNAHFLLLTLTQGNSTGETCLLNVKQLQVTEAVPGN